MHNQEQLDASKPLSHNFVKRRAAQPSPISLSPSGYWDGDDGSWSTFALQIGTYPQTQVVRVLPSTSGNSIWVVLPKGCTSEDADDCADKRGGTFTVQNSATWQGRGLYTLPLNALHSLPYFGDAEVGFDNITTDWPGRNGISLAHQIIMAMDGTDFFLGYVGLGATSVNISSFDDGYPSLLGTLRSLNLVPSLSFGYTAGASYRSYPFNSQASLTLGGYDSTRFEQAKNVTSSGQDEYRPMLLGVSKITLRSNDSSTSLLSSPVITALDSTISEIWLPRQACDAFETAFGLSYNSSLNLYTILPNVRTRNLASNASIIFTLTSGSTESTNAINITLPYSAFDLALKPPNSFGNTSVPYFPLRRAANDSQIYLGRTFLQEAYLISDYDRGTFSLFPAIAPDVSVSQNIVPISPPAISNSTPGSNPSPPPSPSKDEHSMSTVVIAIVSAIAFVVLLAGISFSVRWYRRKQRRAGWTGKDRERRIRGELGAEGNEKPMHEKDGRAAFSRVEMGVERELFEMPGGVGDDGAAEMESGRARGDAKLDAQKSE